MIRSRMLLGVVTACSLATLARAQDSRADAYAPMLAYLDASTLGGSTLQSANGMSAVNMAAGNANQQANLRVIVSGPATGALIAASQHRRGTGTPLPLYASALISGQAYVDGRGVASINQASGNGNLELNAVAMATTPQGIREATDNSLSIVSASAATQPSTSPNHVSPSLGGTRAVSVDGSAMSGFQGALQLNQIAGSDNAISNALLLTVAPVSR